MVISTSRFRAAASVSSTHPRCFLNACQPIQPPPLISGTSRQECPTPAYRRIPLRTSRRVECRRAANLEFEEVAEVDASGSVQVPGCPFLVVGSPEVDVLRRSGAKAQSQLQRERALENPAARLRGREPDEESLEGHALAQTYQRDAGRLGLVLQALLERGAERLCRFVSHDYPSFSAARRMRSATRPPHRSARARSERWVVRPSCSAWRTAISICSGAVPALAASRIDRTGSVTRMPSRDTTSDGSGGFVVVCRVTPWSLLIPRSWRFTRRCTLFGITPESS